MRRGHTFAQRRFRVADSKENAAAYTRPSNGSRPAPYPQVRMVAIGACGTRALTGAGLDSFAVGERTLAARLLPYLKPDMVVMADRGFPSYTLWRDAQATGAGLLWRVSDSFTLPVDERLSDGTCLSHLNGTNRGEHLTVRVIEYTVTTTHTDSGGLSEQTSELFCLITTLLEPDAAPALELAEAYAHRWTSETIYRHIKIEQCGGRTATISTPRHQTQHPRLPHPATRQAPHQPRCPQHPRPPPHPRAPTQHRARPGPSSSAAPRKRGAAASSRWRPWSGRVVRAASGCD
jgi:hypothetical protein